jgi:hypothetical protein
MHRDQKGLGGLRNLRGLLNLVEMAGIEPASEKGGAECLQA